MKKIQYFTCNFLSALIFTSIKVNGSLHSLVADRFSVRIVFVYHLNMEPQVCFPTRAVLTEGAFEGLRVCVQHVV